ncbi:MAG TPA: hypothetical protein VHB02_03905 [Acidimicrobiales bacterium]|nr:hypothetical protein [Acidimicrobiales bacterium]
MDVDALEDHVVELATLVGPHPAIQLVGVAEEVQGGVEEGSAGRQGGFDAVQLSRQPPPLIGDGRQPLLQTLPG